MIDGCDLCNIQGNIDWVKMANTSAGGPEGLPMRFVYVKASQYSKTRDNRFQGYIDGARKAGLAVGAYHFCAQNKPEAKIDTPEGQAEFFFRASGGLGKEPGELPPMMDWEYTSNPSAWNVEWIVRFAKRCKELWYPNSNRMPILYTYPYFAGQHQQFGLAESGLEAYPLDYASYKSKGKDLVPWYPEAGQLPLHKVPKPWTKATMVQYSGNNGKKVPGVIPDCDRQMFLGSQGEFAEFLGLSRPPHYMEWETNDE